MEKLTLNMNHEAILNIFPDIEIIDDEINYNYPDLSFIKSAIKTSYIENSRYLADVSSIALEDIEVEKNDSGFVVEIYFRKF
jgi:hypothetical protein